MHNAIRTLIVRIFVVCMCALTVPSLAADVPGTTADMHREVSAGAIEAALGDNDGGLALELLADRTLRIESARRLLFEGRARFLLHDYRKARQFLKKATRSPSESADAYYWLGRTYAADGAFALATREYNKAERRGRRDADLQLNWARALRNSGRLLGSLSRVRLSSEQAKTARPGDILNGGVIVKRASDSEDTFVVAEDDSALYRVCRAAGLSPRTGEIHQLAGDIWAAIKQNAQATEAYALAVELLKDEDAIARCRLDWAEVLIESGDIEGYLKQCSRLAGMAKLPSDMSMSQCYARAASVSARQGDIQKQIRYLTLSAELEADVDSLIRLADALATVQRTADARACLERALGRGPSPSQRREIESRRRHRGKVFASPR